MTKIFRFYQFVAFLAVLALLDLWLTVRAFALNSSVEAFMYLTCFLVVVLYILPSELERALARHERHLYDEQPTEF